MGVEDEGAVASAPTPTLPRERGRERSGYEVSEAIRLWMPSASISFA